MRLAAVEVVLSLSSAFNSSDVCKLKMLLPTTRTASLLMAEAGEILITIPEMAATMRPEESQAGERIVVLKGRVERIVQVVKECCFVDPPAPPLGCAHTARDRTGKPHPKQMIQITDTNVVKTRDEVYMPHRMMMDTLYKDYPTCCREIENHFYDNFDRYQLA